MLLLAKLLADGNAVLPRETGLVSEGRLIGMAAGFPGSALGKSAKISHNSYISKSE